MGIASVMMAPDDLSGEGLGAQYPGIFPDQRLKALVLAAAGMGDVAAHWQDYCGHSLAGPVNEGETRLWPMVWQHLGDGRGAAAQAAKLAAQYRRSAAIVTVMLDSAAQIADLLEAEGLEPVFLKGAAMQARAYRAAAYRAMQDVDLYLPADQVAPAIVALEQAGWKRASDRFARVAPHQICELGTSTILLSPKGLELDLHWSPRPVLEFSAQAQADFRANTQIVQHEGRDWRVPGDDWLMFEIVEHGLKQNDVMPVRWLVDALMLMQADDARIDWQILGDLAVQHRLGGHMLLGLEALARLDAPVPLSVLERLRQYQPGMLERADLRARLRYLPRWYRGPWRAGLHYALRSGAPWGGFARYYRQRQMHWVRRRDPLFAALGIR